MLLAKLTSRWSHAAGERQPGSTELATVLVDFIQDDVEVAVGGPWPKCPLHRHELGPNYDLPGHWVCPSDHTILVRVGSLDSAQLGTWTV